MSPAAVEFQTPMISPALQSPNIPPFSFTTDMADDRPLNTNGSRRSRPRLAKVRKQLGKSRTVVRENGAEFNPFRSKVEDSSTCNASFDRVSDAAAAVSNDVSFDFTWKNRDNVVKPNFDDESETTKREAQVEAEEKAKSGNFGFQFSFSASAKGLDKGESIGSSFGVNQSDYVSSVNSEKGEGKVNLGDSGKGECNFVFGTSWRNSNLEESGSDSINGNSDSINGKTVVDDQEKMNVETERVEATQVRYNCNGSIRWSENYVFAFGAGTEKCSGMDDVESSSKDFGNKISRENEDKYASKSCFGNVDPAFELPDEMEKLNINECESVGGGGNKKKYSSMNLNANASGSFVFSSSAKPSSSSNGSSEPIQEQMTDSAASVGADNNDYTISGKGHGEDSASCGNSNSKSFTFQAGLKVNSDTQTNVAASVASFDSQPSDNGASTVGGQRKDESCPSTPVGSGVSFTEFITPNWDPASFKANLYSELNKNIEFNVNSRSKKDKRPKRTRGNLKQSSLRKQVHVPKQTSSQENPRSPECYSPMDFSPYMDNPVADQPSRETSVASKLFFHPDNNGVVNTSHSTDSEVERTDTSIGDQKLREPKEESSHPDGKCASTCYIFGTETAYSSCKEEEVCNNGGATMASARDGDVFNEVSHESVQHCFAQDQKYFAFSASSSAEANLPSRKTRLHKKFGRKKVGKVCSSTVPLPPHASSLLFNSAHDQERDKCSSESILRNKSEAAEQVKKGPVSSTTAFEEACKMWRSRGNQAYKSGYMSKAEDFYTQGINSVPLSETEGCCIKPLVLCYSNRAAARISLGRIREALEDCLIAAAMDPYFLKVYVRAANCHLMLGEIENAMQYYKKLLEPGVNICLDRRITIEAADGLQKAQNVAECTNRSAELLECKTLEAASEALEIITEGLSTCSHSEKLLGMKAEALYLLRKYEEITQLCEQTLCIAEKNFSSIGVDNCSMNMNASGSVNYPLARLWRWHLISKSYFCMGKLEAALDLLQKLEQVGPISDKQGKKILESSISLAATIRELLLCKNAGNEAFRSGKYTEAVEHYTVALSSNIESRPFAAICFCNRAAAHQALGHIADAIADCSLSMALDGNYTKAVSRRAVLHEMIRDYAQAANDLQRLITILQNRSDEKAKQCGSPGRSTGSKEVRQACQRKSFMEEEAKEGVPLDFYLILGVKASDAASDIKKAYRKAALRHHPDKASQFLAKTESGDEGRLWKEIADEVHKDADRLFKMIGEAYAILSDTTKRSEYDHEEEMRKAMKEIHQSSSYRRTSDAFSSYTYRRSGNKQNWHENWKTYGKSHSRW